ncbi:hypothetical protein AUP07_0802 [methanogenic archaeon mixed culture ISO4-G1]|nr:hypothetical protein AUP07_0802 [methanogenic archaeon mixed culture ISO4-G1]
MTDEKAKGAEGFEEKHLLSIMMFLSMNGECRKIEIYENVSSNPRIPQKLDRLEAMGLLTQKYDSNLRSMMIKLTSKGMEAAKIINELDRLLKSE